MLGSREGGDNLLASATLTMIQLICDSSANGVDMSG
jgi:hypothetical protein